MPLSPSLRKLRFFALIGLPCLIALTVSWAQSRGALEIKLTQGTNIALALSPDGKTIVFDLQGTLWRLPVAGGKAVAITDEFNDARQPAWSPDGKQSPFNMKTCFRFAPRGFRRMNFFTPLTDRSNAHS